MERMGGMKSSVTEHKPNLVAVTVCGSPKSALRDMHLRMFIGRQLASSSLTLRSLKYSTQKENGDVYAMGQCMVGKAGQT